MKALKPYIHNNPKLHEALTKVEELQDAFARNKETRDKVFASATDQEVTTAVEQLPDARKAAVASAALAGLSDEALKALPPEVANWIRSQRPAG